MVSCQQLGHHWAESVSLRLRVVSATSGKELPGIFWKDEKFYS